MFQPTHYALYYTAQQAANAQKNAKRAPFKNAFENFNRMTPLDLHEAAIVYSQQWRINGDNTAAQKAVAVLTDLLNMPLDDNLYRSAASFAALVQAFESLRGDVLPAADEGRIVDTLRDRIHAIHQQPSANYTAEAWRALATTAAGVALADETLFTRGTDAYRAVIDHDIHPDGYLPKVVENPNGYFEMLLTVQALTLNAEAAYRAGLDLWHYNNRGVSIVTAALYPLYYYFYPEKWKWGEQLTLEEVQPFFKSHGAYLEMLNLHIGRPTKAIDLILDEQRPLFDTFGGGMTTLTHAPMIRRGLFG